MSPPSSSVHAGGVCACSGACSKSSAPIRARPSSPPLDTALHYGMYDLVRLEQLILRHVAGDFFALDDDANDDD